MEQKIDYNDFVRDLTKDPNETLQSFTPEKCALLHMAFGIGTEAGEILSVAKKHIMYEQPLDRKHMLEELGDLYFFFVGMLQVMNVTVADIEENNIAKLEKRYPEGYFTNLAARLRRDVQCEFALREEKEEDNFDAPSTILYD